MEKACHAALKTTGEPARIVELIACCADIRRAFIRDRGTYRWVRSWRVGLSKAELYDQERAARIAVALYGSEMAAAS